MEIVDIQEVKRGTKTKYEITFDSGNDDDTYDALKIVMSKDDMWQIAHYCHDELSLVTQRRKKK